ncbi:hypothetical protein MBLNU459_g0010t2 [Dothideomycetes sp. NU459]
MAGHNSFTSVQDHIHLPAFLRQSKADIQNKFVDLEWQQRNRLAHGLQNTTPPSQWARLTGDEVLARNRYLNVEPFANNRVKLEVAEGVNDYINASPVVLGNRRYIATQGPKESSTSHFYRMLAAETSSPAVVVMLTQTHEAGREKCFPYFPDSAESPLSLAPEQDAGDGFEGEVRLLSAEEDAATRSTIRKLLLRTRSTQQSKPDSWQEKEVYHLLFTGWPDFMIPEGDNRNAMLQLIALSSRLNSSPSAPDTSAFRSHNSSLTGESADSAPQPPPSLNPRVVHCSAGVGRSGTFIALDYLLAQLDAGQLDHLPPETDVVAETVDRLRQQRMMMVQGESQFVFLYEVLREAWIQRSQNKDDDATIEGASQ